MFFYGVIESPRCICLCQEQFSGKKSMFCLTLLLLMQAFYIISTRNLNFSILVELNFSNFVVKSSKIQNQKFPGKIFFTEVYIFPAQLNFSSD